ncbi:unnamed protein product [Trichogramma brassicae]|uniref:Uncharacterized protein n=1 Tax=Trichogramma brassicae TaxID=86971 RepID=A0A6H5J1E8_9HYME|nr:unnamed protein product [Trichogramma brassicae]
MDLLINEDLLNICLAAEIVVNERNQNIDTVGKVSKRSKTGTKIKVGQSFFSNNRRSDLHGLASTTTIACRMKSSRTTTMIFFTNISRSIFSALQRDSLTSVQLHNRSSSSSSGKCLRPNDNTVFARQSSSIVTRRKKKRIERERHTTLQFGVVIQFDSCFFTRLCIRYISLVRYKFSYRVNYKNSRYQAIVELYARHCYWIYFENLNFVIKTKLKF